MSNMSEEMTLVKKMDMDSDEMRLLKSFIRASGFNINETVVERVRKQIEFPAVSGDDSWRIVNQTVIEVTRKI